MKNEDNIITQFEFFPKGKEKVPLLGVGVNDRDRIRAACPNRPCRSDRMRSNGQDRGKPASRCATDRRGGIAVLKDDRCAFTFIDTGHAPAFDFEKFLRGKWLAAVAHY
jgi:hypothetical protein